MPTTPPSISTEQHILTSAKGSGIKFLGTLFAYGARFALGLLLARFMGAEQYGLYSLADTASYMLIGITLLGLTPAVVRYVTIALSRQDEEALWGALQVGIGIPLIASIFTGLSLFAFAKPLAIGIFHEGRLTPVLWVVAISIPFEILILILSAATRGFNQMQYSVIAADIFLPTIKIIFLIILVFIGLNAVTAMGAHTLGTLIASIMLFYFLHKLFPLNRPWRSARRNAKEMLKFSMPIYGSELLNFVGGNVQTLLLGALNTMMSVGIFTITARINLIGAIVYSAIEVTSQPIVSELHSQGEYKQLGHFYQNMTRWVFISNLPMFLITLLFSKPILSIFGQDFVAGSSALIILSCGSLVDTATGINATLITMTGKAWLNIINTVISLTLQIMFSLLLIPGWGVLGAAIAVASARSLLNIIRTLEVFAVYRLWPYNRSFFKPLIASIFAAIVAYALRFGLDETSLLGAITGILALLATYGGVILWLGLSQEDLLVLKRLYYRLGHFVPMTKSTRN
jgi:O-antigen/teichoic acid export membrane protein